MASSSFSTHRTNGAERHFQPPVMCSSFPSSPPPRSLHPLICTVSMRDRKIFHSPVPLTVPVPDSSCSSSPSCHMLWWCEVSCLSVHLSDMTGNVLHFSPRQGFPQIGLSSRESEQNADLMLTSVFFSAFSGCLHVKLNLQAAARADIITDVVVTNTSPLTSCRGRNTLGHLVWPYVSQCL